MVKAWELFVGRSWNRMGWEGGRQGRPEPARPLLEVSQVYRLLDHNLVKQKANVYLSPYINTAASVVEMV